MFSMGDCEVSSICIARKLLFEKLRCDRIGWICGFVIRTVQSGGDEARVGCSRNPLLFGSALE
jgi:hypothetical protein